MLKTATTALQVEQAETAAQEMQQARDEAARSISDSMLQQEAAMKQAQQARETASQASHQLQKAQQAQDAAEQQRYVQLSVVLVSLALKFGFFMLKSERQSLV